MQENDIIYKIATQIKDKDNLKNDFKEVIGLASDLFKKKYIYTLQEEVDNHIKIAQKNPTKEITLLQSIKPFVEKDFHENIDKCINTLTNLNVFNSLKSKIISLEEVKNEIENKIEDAIKDKIEDTIKNKVEDKIELENSAPNLVKISTLETNDVFYSVNDEVHENYAPAFLDDSVKKDGVYDLDEKCLFSIQNDNAKTPNLIFIFVILLLFINN